MSKPSVKKVKFRPEEMAYDLPEELDFSKLEHIGRGIGAIERHARTHAVQVKLEPDVAVVFKDSAAVNKALRAFINAMPDTESKKHRKTA